MKFFSASRMGACASKSDRAGNANFRDETALVSITEPCKYIEDERMRIVNRSPIIDVKKVSGSAWDDEHDQLTYEGENPVQRQPQNPSGSVRNRRRRLSVSTVDSKMAREALESGELNSSVIYDAQVGRPRQ